MLILCRDISGNVTMFAAMFLMGRKTPRKSLFLLRLVVLFILFSLLRNLYFHEIVLGVSTEWFHEAQMIGFVGLLAMTGAVAWLLFETDGWTSLLFASIAYCTQHVANRLYSICNRLWFQAAPEWGKMALAAGCMLVCLLMLWLALRKAKLDHIVVDNQVVLILSLVLIGSAVVLDLIIQHDMRLLPDSARYGVWIYSLLVAVLVVALQLNVVHSRRTEQELDTVREILRSDQQQYAYEKNMIELVNTKVHDLKHQVASLSETARRQMEEEMKPVLDAYEDVYHTGNAALDVVLTRESFLCREKEIAFTCMANGADLSFMTESDVYSFFGNILENAIEACEKISEKEKKVISLNVEKSGFFVTVHEENYFAEPLKFSGDMPETTKGDTAYHGYGLKSVKLLAEQYGGDIHIETEGDRFILDVLFPI